MFLKLLKSFFSHRTLLVFKQTVYVLFRSSIVKSRDIYDRVWNIEIAAFLYFEKRILQKWEIQMKTKKNHYKCTFNFHAQDFEFQNDFSFSVPYQK